ncbi:MAG: DUF3592 domain-containing protein [Chlorobiaceae bacterium]|nr:DUF3592 domain-containing protein [Chlorobiaceae bacterium]
MKAAGIIKYILLLMGAGILTYAAINWQETRSFIAKAEKTKGTVVKMVHGRSKKSKALRPVVHFTDRSGKSIVFISQTGSDPPAFVKGETVNIFYKPEKPENAKIDSVFELWGITILSGITGGIFFLAGGGMFVIPMMKKRQENYLKQNGTPIETRLHAVIHRTSVRIGGKSPYQILSEWVNPANGKLHVFKSRNIWYDPSLMIMTEKIRVFIKKNDPKKYAVDLSFLPDKPDQDMDHNH